MDIAVAPSPTLRRPADDEAALAWRGLRALHTATQVPWLRYLGWTPARGEHLVQVPTVRALQEQGLLERGLLAQELFWWVAGLGDAWGYGAPVWAILDETAPAMMTREAAAAALSPAQRPGQLTDAGVKYLLARGELYPLYPAHPGRSRPMHLFTAQVQTLAAERAGTPDPGAAAAWAQIRAGLPDPLTCHARPLSTGSHASRLPPDRQPHRPRRQALLTGHREEWFGYLRRDEAAGTYLVEVGAGAAVVVRELPAVGVLPWVLGQADRRHLGHLVAYRPGLT